MNNTIIGTQLLDESEISALNSGLLSLEESLRAIATDGSLLPIFEVAFGNQFDREKAEDLREKWEVENLEWLPKIDIRSAAEINGANGAFAGANNTIYLAAEYISQNVGNGEAIANLLLEEIGHFVDYEINLVDSSGDEGNIFAHLVQGVELNEQELQALKTEDDTALVNIDGQQIKIEQNEQNVNDLLDTVSEAITDILDGLEDAEKVVEGVTSGLKEYLTVIQAAIDNQIFTKLPILGDELQKSTDKAAKFLNDLNNDILAQLEQLEDLVNLSSEQVKQVLFDALEQLKVLKSGIDITDIPTSVADQIIAKFQSEINGDKTVPDGLETAIAEALKSLDSEIFKGEIPTVDEVLEIAITEFSQELRSQFGGLLAEVLEEPLNIIREAFRDAIPSIDNIAQIPESIPQNILNSVLNLSNGEEITKVIQDAIEDGINQLVGVTEENLVTKENLLKDILSQLETKLVEPLAGLLDNVLEQPKQLIEEGLEELLGLDINIGNIGDIANGFTFNINFNQEKDLETSLASDIGFPGLGLTTDGKAKVDLDIDLNLGFGYTPDDGLFLDTSEKKELGIGLNASLPGLEAQGEMGFLLVDVTDKGSQLNADYSVDVQDPNLDGKLTLSEIQNLTDETTTTIFDINTEPNAYADIKLNLVTSIDGLKGLPSIQSDLNVDWDLAGNNTTPKVEFNNVQLDLGSFFDNFAKPIVDKVNNILKPLTPIKDVLKTNIPYIKDEPLNIEINLLNTVFGVDENIGIFGTINDFLEISNNLNQTIKNSGNIPIDFGSFTLGEDGEIIITSEANPYQQAISEDSGGFLSSVKEFDESGQSDETVEFNFPILEDPSQVFNLLLGNNAELVNLTLPRFDDVEGNLGPFRYDFFIPLVVPIPAYVELKGTGKLSSPGITFVYDTEGFDDGNLLQGFYIDGTSPILEVNATITGTVAAGVKNVAAAGGDVWLTGGLDLFLAEPIEKNNEVRFDEIEKSFSKLGEDFGEGLACFFEIKGGVNVGAALWAEHITYKPGKLIKGLFDWVRGKPLKIVERYSHPIAEFNLFNFDHKCENEESLRPNLAKLQADGELRLNLGEFAKERNIQPEIVNEAFYITPNVIVSAFGVEEPHTNISLIKAYADKGNDVIYLSEEVIASVEFHGGDGNDDLYGRSGSDRLFGDAGEDRLDGGEGDDQLEGGEGEDKLFGDVGEDTVQGNSGNDFLDGGEGNDQLEGGDDDDEIYGRSGNDFVSGGNGDDQLSGGEGEDTLEGQAGADELDGGSGNDFLDGGNDSDLIFGDSGNDLVDAGEGDDLVDAGEGDDFVQGKEGDDTLLGGSQVEIQAILDEEGEQVFDENGQPVFTDPIFSNDLGSDTLEGGIGNDYINGETGDDFLNGESGDDEILGETGNDILTGEAGNDEIDGGDDIDTVNYDNSPNAVVVNIDETNTYNNDISDANPIDLEPNFNIESGTAQDGFGTTDILKNLENIIGSELDDVLIGNEKDNEIDGLTGNDIFIGNAGNDYFDGGEGNDAVSYRRDPNAVQVNLADNTANDGFGNTDQIFNIENVVGSEFNDNITGDNNANIVTAGAGADNVQGGAGDDELYGQTDNDLLTGEQGNDEIDGGDDIDTVNYDNSPNAVVVNIDETTSYSNDTSDANPIDLEPNFTIESGTAQDGFGTTDILKNLENIIGSVSDDVLIGNEKDNEIEASTGNDLVIGNGGDDYFDGGSGTDVVSYLRDPNAVQVNLATNTATDGFDATDKIFNIENVIGSRFDDNITGDNKENIITAEAGDDDVKGGAGDDELYGQTDNDLLKGEAGNDLIDGGNQNDTVSYDNSPNGVVVNIDEQQDYENPGGYQHTTIVTEKPIPTDTEPEFTIEKGTAQDGFGTIDILKNLENIIGSESEDVLIGNEKDNKIEGLAGNDIMVGNAGDDTLDGGNENDTASYRRDPNKVNVNLEQNQANDGFGNTDQILNTENVIGSDFNDTITGDEVDNIIHAGKGNDIVKARDGEDIIFGEAGKDNIKGENGNDFIVGGKHADKLDGGNDNDTASYFTSESRVHVSLQQGKGWAGDAKKDTLKNIENLEGSEYEDLLIGDKQNNILSGLGGNDLIKAKAGNDLIDGGEGSDRLYGETGKDTLKGQDGNDLLKGGKGNDKLDGGDGNDNLEGETGKDTLKGQDGNDLLKGGKGNDQLDGGDGNDNLEGETGNDLLKGGAGNDQLDGGDGNDKLAGGAGDDQLYGQAGKDNLKGGAGNDQLAGGAGNDQLAGGAGNDRNFGQQGKDRLTGGTGNDLLKGGAGNDKLHGNQGNDQLFGEGGKDLLKGGEGNDNLRGGNNTDTLSGGEGDDYLNGEAGNDTLEGNEGNDRLYGEDGDDEIQGNTGRDYLDGGKGNDELLGNEDNDRIYGREGDDILKGGTGQDILDGGADDDFIYGEEGGDRLSGDSGEDYLDGGEGSDRLEGDTGDDHLLGKSGRDYLDGGKGEDILEGGDDADLLLGKEGDDNLEGGEGNDELDGGADDDQLYGQDGKDKLAGSKGKDYLDGGEGNDKLAGGEGNDQLYGQDGKDDLSGEDGNDNLYGGKGNDQLKGGKGNDLLSGEEGKDTLNSGDGDDYLEGGDGDDELKAGKGEDQLYGDGGNDSLDAGAGHDYLEGGDGDDEITAGKGDDQAYGGTGKDNINGQEGNDLLDGGEDNDIIAGEAGDDYILGGEGDDELSAGAGNDLLEGGEGNDSLHGNKGDNILDGGEGDDELHGGSGSDTFVLQQGGGYDSVYNFQVDNDFFELTDLTFEELEISKQKKSKNNAVISVLDSGEQLAFVKGVKANELSGFHFFPFGGSDFELENEQGETEVTESKSDIDEIETENKIVQKSAQNSSEILVEDNLPKNSKKSSQKSQIIDDESSEIPLEDNLPKNSKKSSQKSQITDENSSEIILEDNLPKNSKKSSQNSQITDENSSEILLEDNLPKNSKKSAQKSQITDENSSEIIVEDNLPKNSKKSAQKSQITDENSSEIIVEDNLPKNSKNSAQKSPVIDETPVDNNAIASSSPKQKKANQSDSLTGEEQPTETDDELLNGGSKSDLNTNTDKLLLAKDDIISSSEIELIELTTSEQISEQIEDDFTNSTINKLIDPDNSQDPVLASIDTNEALI